MPLATNSISGLNKLNNLHRLKVQEVFCPVSKVTVHTTPLTVGDDLSLRTMIASPEYYDREIAALIYKHISFPDLEHKISFEDFIYNFSSFDRRLILFGIYSTTYKVMSEAEITCDNCKFKFKDKIKSNEILDPSSYVVWDKDVPFNQYYKQIKIDIFPDENDNINDIIFYTKIPSIKDQFDILSLIPPDQMQSNFEKINQVISRSDELALITKSIQINSTFNNEKEVDYINDLPSIRRAINDYITSDIVNKVIEEYNNEFDKYSPSFSKKYVCSNCGSDINYPINIELNLFRQFFNV